MLVRILFFGVLKDLAGQGGESLDLAENATLGDVLSHYEARIPRLKEWVSSIAMSVNQEYAGPEAKLSQGDEIALLPPVSGGAGKSEPGDPTGRAKHAAIARERIETRRVLEGIKRAEDGAAVVFEGVVRDNTRGRRTLYLDYEAYEDMAVKQMEELRDRWLSLPNQLFVQSLTAIILVKDAIQTGTLYYCQRRPQELAEFRWVIDAKDRNITEFEKLWTMVILPVLESQSVTTPLVFSKGADYSHFRRFFYDEATADPEARQHAEWLRQLVGPRETFHGVDLRKLLEERRAFANSENNLGVQLVDVIGSAFFRALNGTLAEKAWTRLGALLVKEAPATIHFIALSAAGRPAGVTAVEHPSAEIVRQIEAQARSMWP